MKKEEVEKEEVGEAEEVGRERRRREEKESRKKKRRKRAKKERGERKKIERKRIEIKKWRGRDRRAVKYISKKICIVGCSTQSYFYNFFFLMYKNNSKYFYIK
jgi:hypothetical protein